MKLSTQTDAFQRRFGYETAIRKIAAAGFDAYDLSLFAPLSAEDPLYGDNFRSYARRLRELSEEQGIVCNQSHAPFPTSRGDEEGDEKIFRSIVRAMEIASIAGAKTIVVHPKQHLPYRANQEQLREMNFDFYRRLIPYCEAFGIRAAAENMWQRNPVGGKTIVDSTCARAGEFRDYLDGQNSPWIVGCLDVGHLSLTGEDPGVMIRALGPERLQALHVHDNDGVEDLHVFPYFSKMNFTRLMTLLAEIGYEGDLTMEADYTFRNVPDELMDDSLALLEKIGRNLIRIFEEKKA